MGGYISFVIYIFAVFKRFSANIYIMNFGFFGSADAFPFGIFMFFIFFESTIVASKPVTRSGGFIDISLFKGVFCFIKHIFADAFFIVLFFVINIFPYVAVFFHRFSANFAFSRMGSVAGRFMTYQIFVSTEVSVADIAVNSFVFAGAEFLHMSLAFFVIAGMVAVFIGTKPFHFFRAVFAVAGMVFVLIGAKSFDKYLTLVADMVVIFVYAGVNFAAAFIANAVAVFVNMFFYDLITAGTAIFIMMSS